MRRAGLQKVRLKERRDIGAAVTIAQRPTFGQKRRFDHASAASGLAQQPDIIRPTRLVRIVPTTDMTPLYSITSSARPNKSSNCDYRFHSIACGGLHAFQISELSCCKCFEERSALIT
jgi:hypothetical protein